MQRWFDRLLPFRTITVNQDKITPGLTVRETDHPDQPITLRFYTGEGNAQYSLTRNETIKLASTLNRFLKKGHDT